MSLTCPSAWRPAPPDAMQRKLTSASADPSQPLLCEPKTTTWAGPTHQRASAAKRGRPIARSRDAERTREKRVDRAPRSRVRWPAVSATSRPSPPCSRRAACCRGYGCRHTQAWSDWRRASSRLGGRSPTCTRRPDPESWMGDFHTGRWEALYIYTMPISFYKILCTRGYIYTMPIKF
jgi:hypothetical protein